MHDKRRQEMGMYLIGRLTEPPLMPDERSRLLRRLMATESGTLRGWLRMSATELSESLKYRWHLDGTVGVDQAAVGWWVMQDTHDEIAELTTRLEFLTRHAYAADTLRHIEAVLAKCQARLKDIACSA